MYVVFQLQGELYYDLYAHYLEGGNLDESHYFDRLEGLLTMKGVQKNATKVCSLMDSYLV